MVTSEQKISYRYFLLIWGFAEKLDCLIWDRYSSKLITEEYLEALRIKEENRGIKLTKEQSHVLESIEDQCRWWYLPTENITEIFDILGFQPRIKDGDITSIIDAEGGQQVKYYQVNLELVNVETNRKAWIGEKKLKKLVSQSGSKF